jgi:uncharacterized protein YjdB
MLFPPTATVSSANLDAGQNFSLTNSSQFVKLETKFPKQYFLLQPRGYVGYDRGIYTYPSSWPSPYGGLLIYHIDEDKSPLESDTNVLWQSHPFLDIEEAHGSLQHLQNKSGNATPDDLFYGTKNKFDGSTDPNSNLYDSSVASTQNTLSGVSVTDISPNVTGQNTHDGSVITTFKVGTNSETIPVVGVTLNRNLMSLNIEEMETLIPTITPDNASEKRLTWTSSNVNVAHVNAGVVTAVSVGTATVKAVSQGDLNKSAECTVSVRAIPVILSGAKADGAVGTETTKTISLEFDKAITGLTAENITITSISGTATNGIVSGSGKNWSITVSDVKQGEVSVGVSSFGAYTISGSPRTINVYSSSPTKPTIITSSLLAGTVGTAYSQILSASGTEPITWSMEQGNLPYDLSLGSAGEISGTPTTTGTFNFTVKATNSAGSDTKQLGIVIIPAIDRPTINTTSLPTGTVGAAYNQIFSASGTEPITWSMEQGSLPYGLNFRDTGEIYGTPTTAGAFNFTAKATNPAGSDSKLLNIVINPATVPPTINTTSLLTGIAGTAYSQTLSASGTNPITWSMGQGNLPNGLNLSDAGEIFGTPITAGTFSFSVNATNSTGSDTKLLYIVINPALVPPTINTTSLSTGTEGTIYSQTLSASGTTPITWSIVGGSLPNGMNLSETGEISGTPITAGTFSFTVNASNSAGSDVRAFSILISPATVHVTGITIEPKTASIVVGGTQTLTAKVEPSNATDMNVTWSSSNTSAATVINGVITGISIGTAAITVKTIDGGFTATCTVTISDGEITTVNPQFSSDKDYAATKMIGISASDLEIADEKVVIKKSIAESIARKLLKTKTNNFEIVLLPWFEAAIGYGRIAAVKIPIKGAQLNTNYPREVLLLKIISPSEGEFLQYAANKSDYEDGMFTLLAKGSETPYSGIIDSNKEYDLMIFIKDGGKYDLDKTRNGFVVDPVAIVNKNSESVNEDSSGCSVFGYLVFTLMGVVPFVIRKNRD